MGSCADEDASKWSPRTLRFKSLATEQEFLLRRRPDVINAVRRVNFVALAFSMLVLGTVVIRPRLTDWSSGARKHQLVTTLIAIMMSCLGMLATWFPERIECLSTPVLEVLFAIQLCAYYVLIALCSAYTAHLLYGLDPHETYAYYSDSQVLLAWCVVHVSGNLMAPIRWMILSPTTSIATMFVYSARIMLGSPEPIASVIINSFFLFSFVLVVAVGKRRIEQYQRSSLLEIIFEKTLRFQSEFALSRINKDGGEGASIQKKTNTESASSKPTTFSQPMSHYVFNLHLASDDVSLQLHAIQSLGIEEHWFVKPGNLVCYPERLLGQGSYGFVVYGEHLGTGMALKVPLESQLRGFAGLANEIRILRRVQHPNIVSFHGVSTEPDEGVLILCLEIVKGSNLKEFVEHPPQDVTGQVRHTILGKISSALRYLHSLEPVVVHGDLKPGNVLIQELVYEPKLADFGLSRIQSSVAKPWGGTLRWMAPEILARCVGLTEPVHEAGELDHLAPSTDIFSFGLLAFYVVMSQTPRPDCNIETLRKQGVMPTLQWTASPVEWQDECKLLCDLCLQEDPVDRADAQAVHICLRSWSSTTTDPTVYGQPQVQDESDFSGKASQRLISDLRTLQRLTSKTSRMRQRQQL